MMASSSSQQIESQTLQQINRLVSASSPSDALESIYTLTSTIQQSIRSDISNGSKKDPSPTSPTSSPATRSDFETVLSIITSSPPSKEFLKSICILLSESKLQLQSSNSKRMLDVEEGDVAVLSFLNTILDYYKKDKDNNERNNNGTPKTKTKQPTSTKLRLLVKLMGKFEEEEYHQSLSIIHSLLDIISIHESNNSNNKNNVASSKNTTTKLYKQSTTLSILSTLLQIIPTPTVTNILQTPHGLNRIIDLFKTNTNSDMDNLENDDEKIILRNESIILAIELVKLNPGISKFMIFEDVYDSIMSIASLEYQAYLSSRQSNINIGRKKNGTNDGKTSSIVNGNLTIVKDCLELCVEMTRQESKMGSETFLSNTMTCQVLTMLLDLRNGVYYRDYDLCLEDYFIVQEEEEMMRKKGGSTGSGNRDKGENHSLERGLSVSSSEDGLDDILLDTPSGGNVRNGSSSRGTNGIHQNGQDATRQNPIPYTTDEESEIISYALTLFQTLIQGGDDDFVDETKNENMMTLKKSASRDSTSSSSKQSSVSTRIKTIVSSKNTKRLSMLLFDMALYTLPPPNSPIEYYVSSVPTVRIQCQALTVMADLGKIAKKISSDEGKDDLLEQILSCPSMYLKEVGCVERVMYLICTGGISFVLDEDDTDKKGSKIDTLSAKAIIAVNAAKKVSMHSLGLLRNILTAQEAKIMVMEAISPPVNDIDRPPLDETKQDQPPQIEISVVQKLVNTMGENLHLLNDPNFSKELKAIDKERMHINVIGAAGALGVFLTNGAGDTSREVLLRLPLPPPPPILKRINGTQDQDTNESTPTLVECMMTYLELGTRSSSGNFSSSSPPETSMDVTFALLRLLTEWIPQTPNVISAVLSSPNSVSLGFLLQQKSKKSLSVESTQMLQAMTGILLGLCMESMDAEDDVGGWSTSSIMNLINVGIGIGKFTQLLEGLKRIIAEEVASSRSSVGPWMSCDMERAAILQWYSGSVNIVRRKVVQELSASNSEENEESDNDNDEITESDKKTAKSLSKLVAHQNSEIETLRQKLSEQENKMASQESEMYLLKRRIGSNPNKVDDLLDEYSAKILLLEIQAKNLKDEVSKNVAKHQAYTKEQDDEMSQLKVQLENSRSETEKISIEKNTLNDELKQLKFAYSNLENEYNRVTSESSVQTIGDKTAESSNVQNTNYQALESENQKLKNDILNANNWMSKAVKKMDDLTKRNTALEAETTRLSNANVQSDSASQKLSKEADQMKRQLHDITNERDGLKTNIRDCKEELSKLQTSQQEFQNLQAHSSNIKIQLEQVEKELENQKKTSSEKIINLQQQLDLEKEQILNMQKSLKKEEADDCKLQQEHANLSNAYKAAQEWMANAVKLNDKLKKQMEEIKNENTTLRSSIQTLKGEKDSCSISLEKKILSLTKQRDEALEKQMISNSTIKDFELSKDKVLDEKRSLQEKLNEAMKLQLVLDDSKTKVTALEEQVSQATLERNQALETEKGLREKLEKLTLCQEELSREITVLKEKNERMVNQNHSESEILKERSINLQNELDTERLKNASEIRVLEKTLEASKEKNEQLQKELNSLKNQSSLSTVEREAQNLAYSNLQKQIEMSQKENKQLKVEKEEHVATIENMHKRLNDFQTWAETAQERFTELDLEKQNLQERIDKMKAEEEAILKEKSEIEERIKRLTDEVEFMKQKEETDSKEEKELRSEILSLQVEIGNLDGKNRALSEDNKVLEKKNHDLSSKADLLDEVEESLFEKENEVAALQDELTSEKEKTQRLQSKLDEISGKERGKIEELESIIREKETQLVHQEAEAREAISKWEERCESISTEIKSCKDERDEVERSFLKLEAEIESYHVTVADLNKAIDVERQEKSTLIEQNEESEKAYKNHISELENAINAHVEAVQQYESQLDERDEALVSAGAEIDALNKEIIDNAKESEDVVAKWQENSKQLEETIAGLEATIDNQDSDANAAIAQWEARCNSFSEQIVQLEQQLDENDFDTKIQAFESSLSIKNEELTAAREKENRLCNDLEEKNSTIARLHNELQAVKGSLSVEREHREDNILEVQTLSAEKANILEQLKKEKSMLKQTLLELENVKMKSDDLSAKLNQSENAVHALTQSSKKHEEDRVVREEVSEQEKQELLSQINALEEEKRFLEESNEIDKGEAHEMRLIIGQLENELKEANDMLQSHLTDEVTARATEMATNALRAQLKESREKQSYEHEAFLNEKEGRQIAEKEVEKLKADLALLLQAENISDTNDTRMQRLTSKAAGEVLERQRDEIDALTKSLEQLMQELQSCQSKEREAEERAANSRLHASACEQELLGAKSDVTFLKDSIEILKKEETKMRATLENRVKVLEDERDGIMVSLGSEIKNLKAEISQDQMERDRLIHALNESEKANSALVYSTSVEHGESDSPLELELSKLRLEKAQLLAAVQENGSKFEQRIRSACSDEKKNSEKELIEAAERSLSGLQKKYDETVAQLELANTSNADLLHRMKETNMSELKNDVFRLETEVQKLQKINENLESRLLTTENESKTKNSKLEEKCRLAEAKIIDLERQERKEAALAAEVARLRDEAKDASTQNDRPSAESKESSLAADEMHDVVLELKQTVREERQVYQDLLSEHEDLLALLAQQDLEKSSLQLALVRSVGEEAVENAFTEAERQSMQQFGKYIKLK